MKRKFTLSLVLGLVLTGMSVNLLADDTAQTETPPAQDEAAQVPQAPTEAEADNAPSVDINASAAPAFSGQQTEGQVTSLRTNNADDASYTPDVKHWSDSEVIDRNYFQQPPMVPHKVEEYKITARYNKCMSCHSWDNYKKNNATKISQTHFKDRDGKDHSTLAARRYFCTQCHVPQVDAPPLVENDFTPVKELSK